ncbi:MAG TPA: hypothetical protein VF060_17925 [Trebonia sp.]
MDLIDREPEIQRLRRFEAASELLAGRYPLMTSRVRRRLLDTASASSVRDKGDDLFD